MICKLEIDINYVNVGTFFVRFIDVKARSFSLFQEMDSMLSDHVMALHAGKNRQDLDFLQTLKMTVFYSLFYLFCVIFRSMETVTVRRHSLVSYSYIFVNTRTTLLSLIRIKPLTCSHFHIYLCFKRSFIYSLNVLQNTSANSSLLVCEADKPLSERLKISPGEHIDFIPHQLLRKVHLMKSTLSPQKGTLSEIYTYSLERYTL